MYLTRITRGRFLIFSDGILLAQRVILVGVLAEYVQYVDYQKLFRLLRVHFITSQEHYIRSKNACPQGHFCELIQ